MISTRGRYALRVLIDLAENQNEKYVPLKDITSRQEISQKYLESIMSTLSKAGLVDSVHGKGGGYKLNRDAKDYSVGEILRLTENSMAPVSCLEPGAEACDRAARCKTLPMWIKLDALMNNFLDGISLADLMESGELPEA